MSAHFLIDDLSGDVLTLVGDEARHAARALRVAVGESVSVTDGRGGIAEGMVTDVSVARVSIEVRARRAVPAPAPRVRICPAVPKKGKLDLVVEKLTELGAARISPWFAARSVVRWDEAKRRTAGDRLRKVAVSALKQSRRAWLPVVDDPGDLNTEGVVVVLHQSALRPLRTVLPTSVPEVVTVVVGPEGGLEEGEMAGLSADGAVSATLGEGVLRAETASIASCVLVLEHFHLLG